ncbi:MAG: serine/threonine protein kinase, partial [Gemmataceae bacterium]|nr:serine/threonine protein kinase [Gemmataceae bacterium]
WEEARERGESITAEELCRECPELLDAVRERIRLLGNAGWMMKPSAVPPDKPRTLAERYSLETLIGSGGYAQVWRAYDLQLHRHVAVKVPRPSRTLTVSQIEEVLTEARQIARLRHVNIITVHDVVKEGAGYFIVTDLIDGETLAERLKRGPMPPDEAAKLLAEVARVIDYAHGQGVIHRDLKPANVFLDKAGRPHVGDFGLARSREDLMDGSDQRGTLAYSSPEQLEGKPLDGRSDIWSLGVILFEMFTGRQPFADDNPARLRQTILSGVTPALPGVPEPLSAVCLRCLAQKPEDRFARGNDLAVALEAAFQPRKSRRWLLAVGILAITVIGVAAWASWPKPEPEHGGRPQAAPQSGTPEPKQAAVDLPARDDAFRVFRGHDGA